MSAAFSPDQAFTYGGLPLADCLAACARLGGNYRVAEAIESALAAYRAPDAGAHGIEYPHDSRAAAALALCRALGIEMSAGQRARFWGEGRPEELAELAVGYRAAGCGRGAISQTARATGLSVDEVHAALEWLTAPPRLAHATDGRGDDVGMDQAAPFVAGCEYD